jgi:hypothetical protein
LRIGRPSVCMQRRSRGSRRRSARPSSRPSRQRNCSVVSRKRLAEQLDPALAAGVVALYPRVRGVRREVEWRVQLRHARRQNRPTRNQLRQLPLPHAADLPRHQHAELQDPRPSPHAHPPAAQASAASTPTSRAPDTAHDSARPRLPLSPRMRLYSVPIVFVPRIRECTSLVIAQSHRHAQSWRQCRVRIGR